MAFLSQVDRREVSQSLTQASFVEESSFGDTFAASVGMTFDEDLSISSMLNMQGFDQRKEQVKQLGDSGAFNVDEYTSPVGDVDYKKISTDFPDFNLKSDQTLFEERSELLKKRREYGQDVISRGNGMAQFLGMANAFMLDPVNIATMPIATAGTAVKGLGALGKALQVGKNEALLAIGAELMIQPLVYEHKHDINSPFEFKDALLNIVAAATGAAALGGLSGGISGYLKGVREKTAGLDLGEDAEMALSSLARIEDDLNLNPERIKLDIENVKAEFIAEVKADLTADASGKIPRGERKKLNTELKSLEGRLSRITEEPLSIKKQKGVPARKAKAEAQEKVKRSADEQRAEIQGQIDALKIRIDADSLASNAEADLSRLEQGILSGVHERRLNEITSEIELSIDQKFMEQSNIKTQESNQPSKVKENYTPPPRNKATSGTITQRERAVVERNGLTEDYDTAMQEYNSLENKRIIQDDEIVDADVFMKSIDDEIKGIDEVLTCAI